MNRALSGARVHGLLSSGTRGVAVIKPSDRPTELAWLAHCDYLRALQCLGNETLAHHDQRGPAPFALTVVSGLNTALSRGWRSALVVLRAPGRAARWRPAPIAQR